MKDKDKNIYIGITFVILGLTYFIYYFNPTLFSRTLNLWPILLLICGVLLQYLYFEVRWSCLLISSSFCIVYGVMYTLNFYVNFIYTHSFIAIFFLALATSLLNYYVFVKCSDLILPFIFLFILTSMVIFLYPIYKIYIPIISTELTMSTIFIIIGIYMIFSNLIKIDSKE